MRTNILITSAGALVNPGTDLIPASELTGGSPFSVFANQITLEFYSAKILQGNLWFPDPDAVVTTGLSGTVQFQARPSKNSPYIVDLPNGTIDISSGNVVAPFIGLIDKLDVTCTDVVGAAYINILIDRN